MTTSTRERITTAIIILILAACGIIFVLSAWLPPVGYVAPEPHVPTLTQTSLEDLTGQHFTPVQLTAPDTH